MLALPMMAATSYTVVLDPGHGGKDPGAVGKFSQEKDLNLSLALQVGKLLTKQYPDVKVVYTRSTDVFIPLQQRADIANKANADLFISIHTNSAESKTPSGVETFILGSDKAQKNLDVAMRENAVMKLEADYKTTYQGFDPNSIDSYIMFELMQNSYRVCSSPRRCRTTWWDTSTARTAGCGRLRSGCCSRPPVRLSCSRWASSPIPTKNDT